MENGATSHERAIQMACILNLLSSVDGGVNALRPLHFVWVRAANARTNNMLKPTDMNDYFLPTCPTDSPRTDPTVLTTMKFSGGMPIIAANATDHLVVRRCIHGVHRLPRALIEPQLSCGGCVDAASQWVISVFSNY